jgi:hypothetical protein
VDRSGSLNKNNFLPKSVSSPTGTKVTLPSNVRIISVPSGTNVVSSGSGVTGVNHTTHKIMSTAVTGAATTQVTTFSNLSQQFLNSSALNRKMFTSSS